RIGPDFGTWDCSSVVSPRPLATGNRRSTNAPCSTVSKNAKKLCFFSTLLHLLAPFRPLLRTFRVIPDNPLATFGTFPAAKSRNRVAGRVNPSKKCNLISEHLPPNRNHVSDHLVPSRNHISEHLATPNTNAIRYPRVPQVPSAAADGICNSSCSQFTVRCPLVPALGVAHTFAVYWRFGKPPGKSCVLRPDVFRLPERNKRFGFERWHRYAIFAARARSSVTTFLTRTT